MNISNILSILRQQSILSINRLLIQSSMKQSHNIMMLEEQESLHHLQEFKEVTYQQFFHHPLRNDNIKFYIENKILRNPGKVLSFFKQFDSYSSHSQIYILNELLLCLKTVTTNGRLLAVCRDPSSGKELVQYIIASILKVEQSAIRQLLHNLLHCVLKCHSLQDRILKETLKELVTDFYDNKVQTSKLLTTAQITQSIYQNKVQNLNQPNNPMLFHGQTNNQIHSVNNKNIGWVFGKGFTLAMWIWFEPITSKPNVPLGKLFTFYAEGVGGLEAYVLNEKLFYRHIGPRYSEPSQMVSGTYMCSIEPHKWHFFAVEHEQPKTFSKSKVNVYLDKKLVNSISLDPPKPNPTCPTKISFFDNLYCQTSPFCLYFSPVGTGRLDEFSRNVNSIQYLKDAKALIFEQRGGKLVERSGFGWIDAKLFKKNRKILSQHMLPFFYLLRFVEPDSGKPLNELLALVISFLVLSKEHQQQAEKSNFFQMLGILICDLNYDASDENTIKILNSIKQSITDQRLLDKFFSELLWKLLDSKICIERKIEVFSIVKICFTHNLDHFSPIIGLDNILNYLAKHQIRKVVCCQQHQKTVGKLDKPFVQSKEQKLLLYILQLVELLFVIPRLDMNVELMKLIRLTVLKFSPCFQLALIHLIKKIFIERLNDKTTQDSFKKTLKTLGNNKIHLLFLEVISSSQFIDIKAETLKFLFSLISWKISPIDQEEVAAYISQERFLKFNSKKQLSFPSNTSHDIQINQIEASSPTKSLGFFPSGSPQQAPQAPGMRNSRKPGRFKFPTIQEEKPQIHPIKQTPEVQEEEKTSEPEIKLEMKFKKKFNKDALIIDTEEINEHFQKEMNPTYVDEECEQEELEKIRQLTKKCLAAMNKLENTRQYTRQHTSHTRPAPLSARQKKSFTFPAHTTIAPLMSTRNRDVQERKRRNFDDLVIPEQSQLSASNKKSSGVLSIEQRTTPRLSPSQKNVHQNLIVLYTSMIEMVFQRNINKVTAPPPKIESMNCLYILLTWTRQTTTEIKQLVLADLSTITESSVNLTMLAQSEQVLKFVITMIQQSLQYNNTNLLSDSQELLKKLAVQMFFKDPNCDQKLFFMVNWPSKIHIRYVWNVILRAIEEHCSLFVGNDILRQKNFCNLCMNTELLIYYANEGYQPGLFYVSQSSLPSLMKQIFSSDSNWIDQVIAQQLFRIFNKYFVSQTYHERKKNIANPENDQKFIESVLKRSSDYIKETLYFFGQKGSRGSLLSLTNIYTSYIEVINKEDASPIEFVEELIALTKLLFVYPEILTPKEYIEKKSQILEVLSYTFKILVLQPRQAAGKEIYNYIVRLKSIMRSQLNLIGLESGPTFLNNLIGEFLLKYFNQNGHIFERNGFEAYSHQLNIIIEPFSQPLPIKRFFDQNRVNSRLIKLDERTKEKYEEETLDFVTNTIQEERNRQHHVSLLENAYARKFKNQYKQLWKKLRLYDSIWAHPDFYFQNDNLFSKISVSFERMQKNPIYEVKIGNHESRSRTRVFLTPKLKEPQIVVSESETRESKEKSMIFFDRTFQLVAKTTEDSKLSLNQSILELILPWKSQKLELRKAQLVNTLTLREGYITITNQKLLFIYSYYEQKKTHLCMVADKIRPDSSLFKEWPLQYVREVQRRRFINQKTAIEIFLVSGKSIFINFPSGDSDEFARRLVRERKNKCPNLVYYKTLEPRKIIEQSLLTKRWNNCQLTNFEYLMQLNSLSGRSYRDISQYPVFPWLITSFAEKLDLGSMGSYRDLNKNMGSLGSENRIYNFQQKYEGLALTEDPFHFGTHYSSPGVIFHYLVRLPPYTQGLIILQSGHFDFADRMFFSIYDSFRNCITEQSDVRELIPQFFTIPEMFLNLNHYDFGLMQNNKRVHNVELPLWAKDNPYFYVSRLRKAIQSLYVNHNIHHWMDLIFGYKQKGEEARKNLNTFINITYEDSVDFSQLSNSEKLSKEAQILNYGQTPSQLFSKPHPQKVEVPYSVLILADDIQPKVYRPPQKKNESVKLELNPLLFNSKAIIKLKQSRDSSKETRLICVRKSGDVVNYKWSSQSQSQIPFQCIMEEQRKFQRMNKTKYDPNEFYDSSLHPESFPVEVIKNGEIVFIGGLYQGKLLALNSDDLNSQTQVYKSHHDTISVLKCDANDKFLISGDVSGDVTLWRISNHGKLLLFHKYSDHSEAVTSVFVSEQLKIFATSSKDGSVHLYNIVTGEKMRSYFHPDRRPINNALITTSPLAAIIMFCVEDRVILSYSINGQLLKTEKCLDVSAPCILKYQKGLEYLAYGSENGKVVVRDTPFLDNPKVFTAAKEAVVTGIAMSKDYKFLICCCSDGQLSVIAPYLGKG